MQIMHTDLKSLLARLFNGNTAATRPPTLYLGLRTDAPAAGDTLATVNGNEIAGGSYARVAVANTAGAAPAIPDAASGNDWQLSLPATNFPPFTAPPVPNAATHWFLTDQAAGYAGKLYASGPLNPAAVSSTLQAAAASGQAVIAVTNAVAASLLATDYVLVGTVGTGATQERGRILTVGAADSAGAGKANVTLAANLASAHASGEPVSRDGKTRTYDAGATEMVTASLVLAQG